MANLIRYGKQAEPQYAAVTFDVPNHPDFTTVLATGAYGTGLIIPNNAIITRCFIDVITTFTDGNDDDATIALHIQSADDLVAAVAITGSTWDAGLRGTLAGMGTGADAAQDTAIELAALKAASWIKTTADRELTFTIGTDTLTLGKANVYVEYFFNSQSE